MTFQTITIDAAEDGRVLRLTLDTGARGNVVTAQALEDLHAALDEVERLKPRVMVLAGAGSSFSRGADLDTIEAMGAPFEQYINSEFDLFDRIDRLPFATVALLTGAVIGNAAELALAFDFRLAARSSRFSLPEVAIGFVAPAQRLARYVGIGVAKDLLLNARMLSAEEAAGLGLITRVVDDEALADEAAAFVADLADRAPIGVRATKEGIANAYGYGAPDWPGEAHWAWATYRTEDAKEGMRSVAERRKPAFQGK